MNNTDIDVDEILESATVLELRPNDVLVLMSDNTLVEERVVELKKMTRDAFNHERVVILDGGISVGVARKTAAAV